jgi:hypothetical protein
MTRNARPARPQSEPIFSPAGDVFTMKAGVAPSSGIPPYADTPQQGGLR